MQTRFYNAGMPSPLPEPKVRRQPRAAVLAGAATIALGAAALLASQSAGQGSWIQIESWRQARLQGLLAASGAWLALAGLIAVGCGLRQVGLQLVGQKAVDARGQVFAGPVDAILAEQALDLFHGRPEHLRVKVARSWQLRRAWWKISRQGVRSPANRGLRYC